MNKVKAKGSGTLFRNPLLERLSKTNPLVILAIYLPMCAFLLWYFHGYVNASYLILIMVFLLGIFTWTFIEYILHRFIFHYADESTLGKRFHYLIHGIHHEYPRDEKRLVMPPVPSLMMATGFYF